MGVGGFDGAGLLIVTGMFTTGSTTSSGHGSPRLSLEVSITGGSCRSEYSDGKGF